MSKPNNKDKDPQIDESVLDQDPPNINEPQNKDDDNPENQDPNADPIVSELPTQPEAEQVEQELEEEPKEVVLKSDEETQEQKDARYKAQQTEVQIQVARNKALIDKVLQGKDIPEPTIDELKIFVAQDGVNWDELTVFEQATARRTCLQEKRFDLINEAVVTSKKIDEWAKQVDTFIDSTDSKPEFVELSGHEAEFRNFCMKESHRGVVIDSLLLPAFLKNLPKEPSKRTSLFNKGGGGEKDTTTGKIIDTDQIVNLRNTNPREYKRLVKAGKIAPEL